MFATDSRSDGFVTVCCLYINTYYHRRTMATATTVTLIATLKNLKY